MTEKAMRRPTLAKDRLPACESAELRVLAVRPTWPHTVRRRPPSALRSEGRRNVVRHRRRCAPQAAALQDLNCSVSALQNTPWGPCPTTGGCAGLSELTRYWGQGRCRSRKRKHLQRNCGSQAKPCGLGTRPALNWLFANLVSARPQSPVPKSSGPAILTFSGNFSCIGLRVPASRPCLSQSTRQITLSVNRKGPTFCLLVWYVVGLAESPCRPYYTRSPSAVCEKT